MSSISQVQGSTMAQALSAGSTSGVTDTKSTNSKETTSVEKTTSVSGRTVGNPKLSEKAAKYYEQLKKKFSNVEFILVSEDQKQAAQAQAGSYANPNMMVVLIDEDKIERMAEDEEYRKQYEGIIASAQIQLSSMGSSLSSSNVKAYGMKVDSKGLATLFAVVDKSMAAQRERIAKKAEEKKKAKKAEEKREAKEEKAERLEEKRTENRNHTEQSGNFADNENLVVVEASSMEELLNKINDITMEALSDQVRTDEERKVGQHIDFRM